MTALPEENLSICQGELFTAVVRVMKWYALLHVLTFILENAFFTGLLFCFSKWNRSLTSC